MKKIIGLEIYLLAIIFLSNHSVCTEIKKPLKMTSHLINYEIENNELCIYFKLINETITDTLVIIGNPWVEIIYPWINVYVLPEYSRFPFFLYMDKSVGGQGHFGLELSFHDFKEFRLLYPHDSLFCSINLNLPDRAKNEEFMMIRIPYGNYQDFLLYRDTDQMLLHSDTLSIDFVPAGYFTSYLLEKKEEIILLKEVLKYATGLVIEP